MRFYGGDIEEDVSKVAHQQVAEVDDDPTTDAKDIGDLHLVAELSHSQQLHFTITPTR